MSDGVDNKREITVLVKKFSRMKEIQLFWLMIWLLLIITPIFASSKFCESGGIGRHARFRI